MNRAQISKRRLFAFLRKQSKDRDSAFGGANGDITAVRGESQAVLPGRWRSGNTQRPTMGFGSPGQVPKNGHPPFANGDESFAFNGKQNQPDGTAMAAKDRGFLIGAAVLGK